MSRRRNCDVAFEEPVMDWRLALHKDRKVNITGWRFQTFLIFHNIWDNPSHWLILFKMVKTTNQLNIGELVINYDRLRICF